MASATSRFPDMDGCSPVVRNAFYCSGRCDMDLDQKI